MVEGLHNSLSLKGYNDKNSTFLVEDVDEEVEKEKTEKEYLYTYSYSENELLKTYF